MFAILLSILCITTYTKYCGKILVKDHMILNLFDRNKIQPSLGSYDHKLGFYPIFYVFCNNKDLIQHLSETGLRY